MTEDSSLNLLVAVGFLVLVVSALAARRPSWRTLVSAAVRWIAIFALVFVVFAYRDELNLAWQRLQTEFGPNRTEVVGSTIRIRPQDGHYFVTAEVNGSPVRFLIDTGATLSAIGTEEAADSGVVPSRYGFPVVIQTANGTVQARRAVVDRLKVGPIEREDFTVIVAPSFGDLNVLGMNFLSSLQGWRVVQGVLILES